MPEYLVCKKPFTKNVGGVNYVVRVGDIVAAGNPVARGDDVHFETVAKAAKTFQRGNKEPVDRRSDESEAAEAPSGREKMMQSIADRIAERSGSASSDEDSDSEKGGSTVDKDDDKGTEVRNEESDRVEQATSAPGEKRSGPIRVTPKAKPTAKPTAGGSGSANDASVKTDDKSDSK